ncbi:MAG: DTW domain-containing protein [Deltaproteobacteria bacterium]|nr:DTW domain-containing protein [Deltaproteobacteria bacterium]
MGTRSKRSLRCSRCRMHPELCICQFIPRYDLATRLILVMHRREYAKPTSTGPLVLAALTNSELRIQGHPDQLLDLSDLNVAERRTLLLYPGEGAPVLNRAFLEQDDRPISIVVPDGTWSQSARMGKRLPGIGHAEMVRLPEGPRTEWKIRKEVHPYGVSTFEAIARAFGIIESIKVQQELESLFRLMVRKTLLARGVAEK